MEDLLHSLAQSRQVLLDQLASADLSLPIANSSKKRVQDVLCHIAQWESTVAASIEAHQIGAQLDFDSFDINAINARVHEQHAHKSEREVLDFLTRSRENLLAALRTAAPTAEARMPWGRMETLEHIAEDMGQHERHHSAQIAAARIEPT